MINLGGIGKAISRIVSAPFKAVGNVLGAGKSVNVSAPDVSATQVVPSTAAAAPEAPVLGTENTTQDKKKKKGKSSLLINNDSQSSNSSGYSGLNI